MTFNNENGKKITLTPAVIANKVTCVNNRSATI